MLANRVRPMKNHILTEILTWILLGILTWILASAVLGSGWLGCGPWQNPNSPDYPCGTRAHKCASGLCCWNGEACGGEGFPNCPAGMCCFEGERELGSSIGDSGSDSGSDSGCDSGSRHRQF